jgi:hypothetical protein
MDEMKRATEVFATVLRGPRPVGEGAPAAAALSR